MPPKKDCQLCNRLTETNSNFCSCCQNRINQKLENVIPAQFLKEGVNLNKLSKELINYYYLNLLDGQGLYLWGDTGVGKSYAVYAMARELILSDKDVMSIEMSSFLNQLRAGYSSPSVARTNFERMNWLMQADYLIIDDICAEKPTQFIEDTIFLLINKRCDNAKITLISSNVDFIAMAKEKLGDRIASRLNKMCKIMPLIGPDRRIKKNHLT